MIVKTENYNISTHTSLAGRDIFDKLHCVIRFSFLLTRPLRDVTPFGIPTERAERFLLTRPLRDVTQLSLFDLVENEISTHTSLAGRDRKQTAAEPGDYNFYSHVPCGT